ncbi:MAG: peptide MFS transporter [Chlamydiales bacterium]
MNPLKDEFLGHPKGLFILFTTEMWERFSYYGMRALMVLTLIAGTNAMNPGFGWSESEALILYGWYTGLVYFTPLFGGWLADHFIGQRRSVLIGGVIMALAQFTLAYSVPGKIHWFYVGLVLLVLGNGFFKPNISTMVGSLYPQGDQRRDGAFTIFYMGINLGAFLSPLVASTLGENPAYGWKYGYMTAGIGMTLSVIIQLLFSHRYLGHIGMEPSAKLALQKSGGKKEPLTALERDRIRVIFVLFIFVVLFWASFEQAGGLMNIYAAEKTDRMIASLHFEIPSGWFQSMNPFYIITLAPLFSILWMKLGARNPSAPIKMVFGLLFTALGFLFMIGAVFDQKANGLASMSWLAVSYLFQTMGELCISPVGLSMTTKLAPLRLASLMMGIWLLINFFANLLAGLIGSYAEDLGELAIFSGIVVANFVFALVLWGISGKLIDWMHGAEVVKTETAHLE